MGLTTALYTGLSGLTTNSLAINVAGNNIANVNTTGYKATRAEFETQVSQNLSKGTAPNGVSGGTNPSQVGLGTRLSGVTRAFTAGSISPTGVNTDLAIEGNGFFVVNDNGSERYTRAGSFKLDRDFNLVAPNGAALQGFAIDEDFAIVPNTIVTMNIPIGALTLAEATQNIQFTGNLNAGGDITTQGAQITSAALFSDNLATTAALDSTGLTSLFDSLGTQLFTDGDVVTLTGASKGGATLPPKTFQVGATNTTGSTTNGTTLADFMTFLEESMGIDPAIGGAGVTVNGTGQLVIAGNGGEVNDLAMQSASIIRNQGTNPQLPFTLTKDKTADGESVRTTFVAFDSLGQALTVDLSIVLQEKTNAGTSWRFFAQSEDDSDLSRLLGNGTLNFDTNGTLISVVNPNIRIDRENTGAATPQEITLDFEQPGGEVSALADTTSQVAASGQDGSPIGTLEDFTISQDGTVVGVFSNSLLRNLGQVALARFSNPSGLEDVGGNQFRVGVNSGLPQIAAAGTSGNGRIVGGALELSNVDLSQEFINLITASTGFSAASRVLTTSDQLIQQLLATIR